MDDGNDPPHKQRWQRELNPLQLRGLKEEIQTTCFTKVVI